MTKIDVKHLSFKFGSETVFSKLDMHVASCEFVAILGASGCGKSTLLRVLAGLLSPSDGDIVIDENEGATSVGSLDTSFVFQKPTLCPWLSARANVELPLRLQGCVGRESHRIATDSLRLVGLDAVAFDKRPAELSGGMQMRVSLARAVATNPVLMLMDEPFSALDEVSRHQLTETFVRLREARSWTTVFVTHNVSEAVFLSERILIMAGSPARMVDEVHVPSFSRDQELRKSKDFHEFVANVSARFRSAVEADSSKLSY